MKIYDVAAQSVASAYDQAVADGAGFVVGPLTKADVAAVAPLAAGRVPTLALNFLGGSAAAPRDLYQFALLPEDEARIVARRLAADGKLRGVAIVPNGEWGDRVAAAFTDELARLGGAVLDTARYDPGLVDFSDIIRTTLQIHEVKGEPVTHRADAAFVFIAGTPDIARLIMPQLKFHYAGDIPVYSTSESFKPGTAANADIDGLMFPDMPWMISADPATDAIRDKVRAAWPAATARRDRLFAFGFDAYRLVPELRSGFFRDGALFSGMTGQLQLDEAASRAPQSRLGRHQGRGASAPELGRLPDRYRACRARGLGACSRSCATRRTWRAAPAPSASRNGISRRKASR